MGMVSTDGPVYMGNGGNGGLFGGSGNDMIGFLIFAMMMGGGGFFGPRGNMGPDGGQYATSAEVQRGFDAQNQMANQREILSAVQAQGQAGIAATNQTFHDGLMATQNLYNELTRDIGAVQVSQANALANQNQCCCETKQLISGTGSGINANIAQNRYEAALANSRLEAGIAQNRFEAAQNTAAIMANNTANTQKILDKMNEAEKDALRARVSQLELQNQLAGVPRYPLQTTYSAGQPPFCGCGWNSGLAA